MDPTRAAPHPIGDFVLEMILIVALGGFMLGIAGMILYIPFIVVAATVGAIVQSLRAGSQGGAFPQLPRTAVDQNHRPINDGATRFWLHATKRGVESRHVVRAQNIADVRREVESLGWTVESIQRVNGTPGLVGVSLAQLAPRLEVDNPDRHRRPR
jgi:hypothetical protein